MFTLLILQAVLISACEISAPTNPPADQAPPKFSGTEAARRWILANTDVAGSDYGLKKFLLDFDIPLKPINWYLEAGKWEMELGSITSPDDYRHLPAADVVFSFQPFEAALTPFQLEALNLLRDFNSGRVTI